MVDIGDILNWPVQRTVRDIGEKIKWIRNEPNPFTIPGRARMAEAALRQINRLRGTNANAADRSATPKGVGSLNSRSGSQSDVLGTLYAQLIEQLQGGSGVGAGYDSQLAAIDQMRNAAMQRGEEGREDILAMYDALGLDYERLAPEAAAQSQSAREEVSKLYSQLSSNIEGNYSRIAQEQADLFSQLGIEAAAPDVITPQSEAAQRALTRASETGAANEQRMIESGNIDESYYRQGAPLARLQGANTAADFMRSVEDRLLELDFMRGDVEAQRASAIAQDEARRQQMLWEMLMAGGAGAQAQQEMNPSDVFISSLEPSLQREVASAFRAIESSEEVIYNRVQDPRHPVPGTFVPVTNEWWLNQIDQMYQNGQISETTYQALLYYTRLRLQEGG